MRLTLMIACMTATLMFAGHEAVLAEPSSAMTAVLSRATVPLAVSEKDTPVSLLNSLAEANSDLSVSVEVDAKRPFHGHEFVVPAGTIKTRLDKLASEYDMAWQPNDGWSNFGPKGKLDDPNWPLNKHIPGDVVLRSDGNDSFNLEEWLHKNNITLNSYSRGPLTKRDTSGSLRTVTLHSPTLREYYNTYYSLLKVYVYTVSVRTLQNPDKPGECSYILRMSMSLPTRP